MGKGVSKRSRRRALERQRARIRRKQQNKPIIAYEMWKRFDSERNRFTCARCGMRFENAFLHHKHDGDKRMPNCSAIASDEVASRKRRNVFYDLREEAKLIRLGVHGWRCRFCNSIYRRRANCTRCEEFHQGRLEGGVDTGSSDISGDCSDRNKDEDRTSIDIRSGEGSETSHSSSLSPSLNLYFAKRQRSYSVCASHASLVPGI